MWCGPCLGGQWVQRLQESLGISRTCCYVDKFMKKTEFPVVRECHKFMSPSFFRRYVRSHLEAKKLPLTWHTAWASVGGQRLRTSKVWTRGLLVAGHRCYRSKIISRKWCTVDFCSIPSLSVVPLDQLVVWRFHNNAGCTDRDIIVTGMKLKYVDTFSKRICFICMYYMHIPATSFKHRLCWGGYHHFHIFSGQKMLPISWSS